MDSTNLGLIGTLAPEVLKPAMPIRSGWREAEVFGEVLPNDVVLRNHLAPLRRHLDVTGATELWINRPGEVMMETGGKVVTLQEPALDYAALDALAQAVAIYSQQPGFGTENPILYATLPDGERVTVIVPPAVEPGNILVTIRIPTSTVKSLQEYEAEGSFAGFLWPHPRDMTAAAAQLLAQDRELIQPLLAGELRRFLTAAILQRKNIAVVGDTGSGKTTLMKSMCQHIPCDERLVTIEDVRELLLPMHENRAHLLYSKGGHSVAKVTPAHLIAACMRLTPTRVLPAELRGSEAWDLLKLLTTGHSGTITSAHAESPALFFERFMFMAKEHPDAAGLSREELKHLVRLTIDVVIHIERDVVYDDAGEVVSVVRRVDEVYFDPWAKNAARFGSHVVGTVTAPAVEEAP